MKEENVVDINPLYLIPEDLSLDPESLLAKTRRQFQRWVQQLADRLPVEERLDFKEFVDSQVNWDGFYIPPAQYYEPQWQRLSFIAFLGALFGGALSLSLFGRFFKEDMMAYIIGAPFGSLALVWLFAWLIRHPKKATLVQALLGLGSAGLTLGVVIATVKRTLFPKSKFLLSGLLASLIGFFLLLVIQLFKPKKTVDTRLRREVMESQLAFLLRIVTSAYRTFEISPPVLLSRPAAQTAGSVDNPYLSFSLDQLRRAMESRDPEMTLAAANSLVNSLTAGGIKPHDFEDGGPFTSELLDYYEPFGLVKPGDRVEVLKTAWIDQHGRPVFKGKLKRVAKRIF